MKASLWAMIVEGWLPRAAAARPAGVALQTPAGASLLYGAAGRCERWCGRAGRTRRGARTACCDRPAVGARLRAGAPCLSVARRRRGAGRSAAAAGGAGVGYGWRCRAGRGAAVGCGRRTGSRECRRRSLSGGPARPGGHRRRDPHLRDHLPAQADRADLRQLPLERARLGRRARPRSPRSAGCARCRWPTSAVSRSSCARRSTPRPRCSTSASTPRPCSWPCASSRSRSSPSSPPP